MNKYKASDREEVLAFLSKVPLFRQLPEEEYPLLAEACEPRAFKPGEVVIRQGDIGKEFFVIRSGEASVHIADEDQPDAVEVRKGSNLKPGDYFGEKALVHDVPRTATIVAETALSTLRITRDKFRELGLNERLHFRRRKGVAKTAQKTKAKEPPKKSAADRLFIGSAVKQNQNLQVMVLLDEERVAAMVEVCWKESVAKGTKLISEDDARADYFYVVQSGGFEVTVSGEPGKCKKIGPGSSFGEVALLCLAPRSATVTAVEDAVVWVFDRDNFKQILMQNSAAQTQLQMGYLEGVEMLQYLLPNERRAIAEAFLELHYAKDEVIFEQGQQATAFYVLIEGTVSLVRDGAEINCLSGSTEQRTTAFFGEQSLLSNDPRIATAKVVSEIAKVLVLDREAFEVLLGPLEDIIREAKSATGRVDGGRISRNVSLTPPVKREPIYRDELQICGMLGAGGFGTVDLYEHTKTHKFYALKSMSKGYILEAGMKECVMSEKEILWSCNSDFIIHLYAAYNMAESLQLLMEVALGGDLHVLYQRRGFYGSKAHAAFYSAGVTCAFVHLHRRKVVYRDLKPENVLINETGHVKLTDMGLAKVCLGKTYTVCGTPDYFAPEMLRQSGHSFALDWWTLGIFIYELLAGDPPFEAPDPMSIYRNISQGINKVRFPPSCGPPASGLVKRLLVDDPAGRIAMQPGGVANLEKHAFYGGMDWDAFRELKVEPPYRPKLSSPKDRRNFRANPKDAPPIVPYKDDGSGWDRDFATV